MLQRIVRWFQDRGFDPRCEKTIVHGDVRIDVTSYNKVCGHRGYVLELFTEYEGRWFRMGVVGAEIADDLIGLLQEAMPFIPDESDGRQRDATIGAHDRTALNVV